MRKNGYTFDFNLLTISYKCTLGIICTPFSDLPEMLADVPAARSAASLDIAVGHIIEHLHKNLFEVTNLSYWTTQRTET